MRQDLTPGGIDVAVQVAYETTNSDFGIVGANSV